MNIRLANASDENKWDAFVQEQPGSSPYHLFAWKKAIEAAYGHSSYYLIAEEKGQVSGVLPLFYFKPPFVGGCIVSSPYCDFADVIAIDDNAKEKLLLEAILLAEKRKTKYVELRGDAQHLSLQDNRYSVNTRSHKVRMLLELPGSSEKLWDGFKSKLRSQIRKAEKNNLLFKWGGLNDLDDFYKVFSRNMLELGSPVHSKKWFSSILHYYGPNARLGLMYHDGRPVGTGIILCNNDVVSIPWASTLRDYNRLSPNMLLYWNFLKYAADNKYKYFDFGRSTPDEGTYKFKAQWGSKPIPLYWHYIMINRNAHENIESHSPNKEKIAGLWKRLPLGFANLIGPEIRKYISL